LRNKTKDGDQNRGWLGTGTPKQKMVRANRVTTMVRASHVSTEDGESNPVDDGGWGIVILVSTEDGESQSGDYWEW
jgi:hypothetical protein